MLFSIVIDPTTSANDLNKDLSTIQKWAHQWKMEFNPDLTKQASEVLFSHKKVKPVHPPLRFNGQVVKRFDDQKHLGLILDSKLSFMKHINSKLVIATKNISVIKSLFKYLSTNVLNQMYKVFVRFCS